MDRHKIVMKYKLKIFHMVWRSWWNPRVFFIHPKPSWVSSRCSGWRLNVYILKEINHKTKIHVCFSLMLPCEQYSEAVVRTVASHLACFPCACAGLLWVIWFPPTVQSLSQLGLTSLLYRDELYCPVGSHIEQVDSSMCCFLLNYPKVKFFALSHFLENHRDVKKAKLHIKKESCFLFWSHGHWPGPQVT